MIDRQHGKLIFECDSCDETLTCDTDNFNEAWNEAKREGWRSRKIGDEWVHGCPSCGV
jgi:hypothetical protein